MSESADRSPLSEIARVFLKLGCIAFGGPAAHIGLMEDEFVRRRRWLTHEEFLDLLGATNLIPGPNSTEMAIHVGRLRGGWRGLIVSGSCFLLPAFVMVLALAWVYVRYGELPQVEAALYGVKPVIIAIVVQALWGLGTKAVKTRFLGVILGLAVVANLLGLNELAVLVGGGLLTAYWRAGMASGGQDARTTTEDRQDAGATSRLILLTLIAAIFLLIVLVGIPALLERGNAALSQSALFYYFLKIGSVLYGSGYVLLAFLQGDLVERMQWLTPQQLLDAVAVGQATPGPLFTTSTFIGYILAGWSGAVLATLGIFLPSFLFVAASGPLIPKIRQSPMAAAVLDGVNAAALALMAVVAWELAYAAVVDWLTAALVVGGMVLLIHFRLNSLWLVLLGIAAGLVKLYS